MAYEAFTKAAALMIGFTTTGTHITAHNALRDEFDFAEVGALDAPIFNAAGCMISHTSDYLKATSPVCRCVPVNGWHEEAAK